MAGHWEWMGGALEGTFPWHSKFQAEQDEPRDSSAFVAAQGTSQADSYLRRLPHLAKILLEYGEQLARLSRLKQLPHHLILGVALLGVPFES